MEALSPSDASQSSITQGFPDIPASQVPIDLIRIVLTLPLFEPIQTDEELVTQLCKALHLRMYQPGDHIIRQKDVAKGMFFIIRGSVTVTSDDGEVLFAELNAPGYFGEIGLVYNVTRTASVVAKTKCILAALHSGDFSSIMKNNPNGLKLLRYEAQARFEALSQQLKFAGKSLPQEYVEIRPFSISRRVSENQEIAFPVSSNSDNSGIIFSPATKAPNKTQLTAITSGSRRRASVAVWADKTLQNHLMAIQEREHQQEGKLRAKLAAIASASISAESFTLNSQELALDETCGYLGHLTRNTFISVLSHLSVANMIKMKGLNRKFRQFIKERLTNEDKAELSHIVHMDLSGYNKKIADKSLQQAVEFGGIVTVSLTLKNCWAISNQGIKSLVELMPNLILLDLSSVWDITDDGLTHVGNHLKVLRTIYLPNCRKISNTGVTALLDKLSRLSKIDLGYCKALNSPLMGHSQWRRMEDCNLQRCTGISDAGFLLWRSRVEGHPPEQSPTDLPIDSPQEHLSGQPYELRKLILSDCAFLTDEAMSAISLSCPYLEALSVSFCCGITENAIIKISDRCKYLETLDISYCGIAVTDKTLDYIAQKLTRLRRLYAKGCVQITDKGIASLMTSASLREINVNQCRNVTMTKAPLESLVKFVNTADFS